MLVDLLFSVLLLHGVIWTLDATLSSASQTWNIIHQNNSTFRMETELPNDDRRVYFSYSLEDTRETIIALGMRRCVLVNLRFSLLLLELYGRDASLFFRPEGLRRGIFSPLLSREQGLKIGLVVEWTGAASIVE